MGLSVGPALLTGPGQIDGRWRRIAERLTVHGIRDNAHDRAAAAATRTRMNRTAKGLVPGQQAAAKRLVDHGDPRRRRAVVYVKVSPGEDRCAVGVEPSGRYEVEGHQQSDFRPPAPGVREKAPAACTNRCPKGSRRLDDARDGSDGVEHALSQRSRVGRLESRTGGVRRDDKNSRY